MGSKAATGPLKAIFFDLDGTLIDSWPGIASAVDYAFAATGIPRREGNLRAAIGPPIREILGALAADAAESQLDRLESCFRLRYDAGDWRQTICFPGVVETLAQLGEMGFGLSIVTNKPLQATTRILAALGLERYFDFVVTRDSKVPAYASKAAMLVWSLEWLQIRPDEGLMVGDTEEDRAAAEAAGVPLVLVANGYGGAPAGSSRACRRIPSIPALLEILDGRSSAAEK